MRAANNVLLDCMPSLGMLTINALTAADSVLIPVQAQYLPAKGFEQLLQTVSKVRRQLNSKLKIDGILLTMVDNRTNYAKEINALLHDTYGTKVVGLRQINGVSLTRLRISGSPSLSSTAREDF